MSYSREHNDGTPPGLQRVEDHQDSSPNWSESEHDDQTGNNQGGLENDPGDVDHDHSIISSESQPTRNDLEAYVNDPDLMSYDNPEEDSDQRTHDENSEPDDQRPMGASDFLEPMMWTSDLHNHTEKTWGRPISGTILAYRGNNTGKSVIIGYKHNGAITGRIEAGGRRYIPPEARNILATSMVQRSRSGDGVRRGHLTEANIRAWGLIAWRVEPEFQDEPTSVLRPMKKAWYPETYAYIFWDSGESTFESRHSLRYIHADDHLKTDMLIYNMAVEQEGNYQEALTGRRPSYFTRGPNLHWRNTNAYGGAYWLQKRAEKSRRIISIEDEPVRVEGASPEYDSGIGTEEEERDADNENSQYNQGDDYADGGGDFEEAKGEDFARHAAEHSGEHHKYQERFSAAQVTPSRQRVQGQRAHGNSPGQGSQGQRGQRTPPQGQEPRAPSTWPGQGGQRDQRGQDQRESRSAERTPHVTWLGQRGQGQKIHGTSPGQGSQGQREARTPSQGQRESRTASQALSPVFEEEQFVTPAADSSYHWLAPESTPSNRNISRRGATNPINPPASQQSGQRTHLPRTNQRQSQKSTPQPHANLGPSYRSEEERPQQGNPVTPINQRQIRQRNSSAQDQRELPYLSPPSEGGQEQTPYHTPGQGVQRHRQLRTPSQGQEQVAPGTWPAQRGKRGKGQRGSRSAGQTPHGTSPEQGSQGQRESRTPSQGQRRAHGTSPGQGSQGQRESRTPSQGQRRAHGTSPGQGSQGQRESGTSSQGPGQTPHLPSLQTSQEQVQGTPVPQRRGQRQRRGRSGASNVPVRRSTRNRP